MGWPLLGNTTFLGVSILAYVYNRGLPTLSYGVLEALTLGLPMVSYTYVYHIDLLVGDFRGIVSYVYDQIFRAIFTSQAFM